MRTTVQLQILIDLLSINIFIDLYQQKSFRLVINKHIIDKHSIDNSKICNINAENQIMTLNKIQYFYR